MGHLNEQRPSACNTREIAVFRQYGRVAITILVGSYAHETRFVGVGNMGLPMAGKFLDDGHEVTVFDLRGENMTRLLERQARPGTSARAIADQLETIFVSLPDLESLRTVCLCHGGIINGSEIITLVNTYTVGAPLVEEIAEEAGKHGITVIDCPISGRPPRCKSRYTFSDGFR